MTSPFDLDADRLAFLSVSDSDDTAIQAMRRQPRQQRSVDRIEAITAAAQQELEKGGTSALTTESVAEAAGVSIGGLYRYFPDKQAILDVLATRYWTEVVDRLGAVIAAQADAETDQWVGAIVDEFVRCFRELPGFRALWHGPLRSPRLYDVTRPIRQRLDDALGKALAPRLPDSNTTQRRFLAHMALLTGDKLIDEAFRINPDGDRRVLRETKRMLSTYLTATSEAQASTSATAS